MAGHRIVLASGVAMLLLSCGSAEVRAQALDQLPAAVTHAPRPADGGPHRRLAPECQSSRNWGAVIGGGVGLVVGTVLAVQVSHAAFPGVGIAFAPVFVFLPTVGGVFIGMGVGEIVCEARG